MHTQACMHTNMYVATINEKAINWKESKDGYMEDFKGGKEMGKDITTL